jgi:hypothetical protein
VLVALRGGYLNAYHRGQSLYKIGSESGTGLRDGEPLVQTHFKYLLQPTLDRRNDYVSFTGTRFELDPAAAIITAYDSHTGTLGRLIASARRYAGDEKIGVHAIAMRDRRVVDVEIAFSRGGAENERARAPRMDVAVLVEWPDGGVRLVFCEAKCADNPELVRFDKEDQDGSAGIAVVRQIRKYEDFIRRNLARLTDAYVETCRTLTALRAVHGADRVDPLVREIAAKRTPLTIHEEVFLLVFGYDADQGTGAVKAVRDALGADDRLGHRVITKGRAGAFDLGADILRHVRARGRARRGHPTA